VIRGSPWGSSLEAAATSRLFGRDHELAVVAGLVDQLEVGIGGAVVLRGEPGIGKSALMATASVRTRERGLRTLSISGVESEARLGFAGLHQLLRPLLQEVDLLPPPQRAALLQAFGVTDDAEAELFLIGLATLELLSDAAEPSPVLVVADDAHWLDAPTCEVLTFVARRLDSERVLMLIGIRDGHSTSFDDAQLREMRLGGLDEAAAGALMDSVAPDLTPSLRARLLTESAGNPLALVELPRAVRSEHLGEPELVHQPLPLTARLERAFAVRGSDLPATTRSLLLVAAADESELVSEVLAATSLLVGASLTVDTLAPAVSAGLVEVGGMQLRFRHPLVRSAVYQAATDAQRRAAHQALADSLADEPERQVWHRAAASAGPDEQVAADLEVATMVAVRRGAIDDGIDAMTRAAQLSEDPVNRGRRLAFAAQMAFESGRIDLGGELLVTARAIDLPDDQRMILSALHEVYITSSWSGADKVGAFVDLTDRIRAAGRVDLAVSPLSDIALRCYWSNPAPEVRADVVAAAKRLGLPSDDPRLIAIMAWADPVGQGSVVIERIAQMSPDTGDLLGRADIGSAATAVWAWDLSMPFLESALEGLRRKGSFFAMVQVLVSQAWAAVHLAQGPLAASAGEEASRLAQETGLVRWAVAGELAHATATAERGDADAAEAMVHAAESVLLPMGANPMLSLVQFARGRSFVSQQRYDEAFEEFRRALDPGDPAYHPFVGTWGLADLIEAAINSGRNDAATPYLEQLESLAAATSGPLLLAEAAFARPLVADDESAEELYRAALEQHLTRWPGYRSRMLFWYGTWLRRQRRTAESRAPLRAARDTADALGFVDLAERARQELRATGESSQRRSPAAWDQLTAQELQIAQMAGEGLSNREIAQRLYISHRTVGSHLHRIFPKLDITSRSQLHAALTG